MKRSILTGVATLAAATLALTACSGGDTGGSDTGTGGGSETSEGGGGPVTISLAGWSLSTTPEFQLLADAFNEANPDVTVELKEYDATEYDTQMIADLAAGSAPDMYIQKNLKNFFTYQDGGQLLDVSDVAGELSDDLAGLDAYEVDGATYAVPYRQDAWYLYYDVDLFEQAGVPVPTEAITWEEYDALAVELTEKLAAAGSDAKGTYQHSWQSTVQGFATAQADGADLLSGEWDYFVPYYERAVALQTEGAQENLGAITTNSLTYQSQFGTQKSAMMLMGSWYVATLLAQQESGEANEFAWGIAPSPQLTEDTLETPVTFADPTGIGVNPAIADDKVDAAKEFLAFIGSEDAAVALAEIGITPAIANDTVADAFFAVEGAPGDDLSRTAFSNRDVRPENPVSADTAALQNILSDAHTAILAGGTAPEAAITEAMARAKSEVLN
ncbi:sugar ABC transporter substrate-binding protein [Serinibacter arcticus]|uniref:Sugar ABC transporter substrate-binding protein n=1 Tax=Serinibacter arcticus TaxID=1655435 RepID=A0A2U1ZUS3_9MICO|nr:extracellular solute-binding protein [Serinibacter arcticus]PWD50672.1 sugar ABC transporter substrate-binding protein [Serinibacter arcticus]